MASPSYYAVSVGTTAVLLGSGRGLFTVANNGTAAIFLGRDANVTTATGFPVAAGGQIGIGSDEVQQWYAISTAAQDVRILIGLA